MTAKKENLLQSQPMTGFVGRHAALVLEQHLSDLGHAWTLPVQEVIDGRGSKEEPRRTKTTNVSWIRMQRKYISFT